MSSPLDPLRGQTVLVTGSTGFKGSWLSVWLDAVGARVHGLGLAPPPRGAYHDLDVAACSTHHEVDVRDPDAVDALVGQVRPDLVFHLAAQPLVIEGWRDRRATFATNVMGTVHVLEAALASDARGVVIATTDKVYENLGHGAPFREGDRLGGHDPYSASKAAAEIAIAPYRAAVHMGLAERPIVAVRAGNVVGGGDWSPNRLVPDIIRSLQAREPVVLRHPDATRPWQHVLDCLWGYLIVGAHAAAGASLAPAYNFARSDPPARVDEVARRIIRLWEGESAVESTLRIESGPPGREAAFLDLDASLARQELGWAPAWSFDEMLARTVNFYRCDDTSTLGRQQIDDYQQAAEKSMQCP